MYNEFDKSKQKTTQTNQQPGDKRQQPGQPIQSPKLPGDQQRHQEKGTPRK